MLKAATCYVCDKPRDQHPKQKWCPRDHTKDAEIKQQQKVRRVQQAKQQANAALKVLEGGTALQALEKVVVAPMDDPIAAAEEKAPAEKPQIPANAPAPASKQEVVQIVSAPDSTLEQKEFYWHVDTITAVPAVSALTLVKYFCLQFVALFIMGGIVMHDWFTIAILVFQPIFVIALMVYYFVPQMIFPNWTGTKVPVYSVVKNTLHIDTQSADQRADLSKVLPVKHENDVWLAHRRFLVFVPTVKANLWSRFFYGAQAFPPHYLGSPNYTSHVLDQDDGQYVVSQGWYIPFHGKMYRRHQFYVSLSQVGQFGQTHLFGGLSREDATRKMNILCRNASGVTYDRFDPFKSYGDTLEQARIFTRHIFEDHLLRTNDLPADFPEAPVH